jgi:hypothetical protein
MRTGVRRVVPGTCASSKSPGASVAVAMRRARALPPPPAHTSASRALPPPTWHGAQRALRLRRAGARLRAAAAPPRADEPRAAPHGAAGAPISSAAPSMAAQLRSAFPGVQQPVRPGWRASAAPGAGAARGEGELTRQGKVAPAPAGPAARARLAVLWGAFSSDRRRTFRRFLRRPCRGYGSFRRWKVTRCVAAHARRLLRLCAQRCADSQGNPMHRHVVAMTRPACPVRAPCCTRRTACGPWRGHPAARRSRPAAATARCGCGRARTAGATQMPAAARTRQAGRA